MQAWNAQASRYNLLLGILIAAFGALVTFLGQRHLVWFLLAILMGTFCYVWRMDRYFKRLRVKGKSLSGEWRNELLSFDNFYQNLNGSDRNLYEQDILYFLAETRISGVNLKINDRIRLMVAASAVPLTFRLPHWDFPLLCDVLVYPGSFDENFNMERIRRGRRRRRILLGEVFEGDVIILSLADLERDFANLNDGQNVGYHEFAHLMDLVGRSASGTPDAMTPVQSRRWIRVAAQEFAKVRQGRSVLRDYAATNQVEFFATAVEFYFTKSEELRRRHPKLYYALNDFFQKDPPARIPREMPPDTEISPEEACDETNEN